MSGNRRKKAPQKPLEAMEEPLASRIVAIPKTPEAISVNPAANAVPPAAKPEAKAKPKTERIGDILRQARLERGDDLYQIADYLCIKPSFLVALENSRYDEFPADAYVIGFLRTYANFLGVDGKEAVDRYRYEMAGRRKKPVLSMPIPLSEGRTPSALIMVGATVAALLIYALWYGISSSNRTEVSAPQLLPSAQTAPASADTQAAAGLTAPLSASSSTPAATAAAIPPASPGIVVTAADQTPPSAPISLVPKADEKTPDQMAKTADAADKSGNDDKDAKNQVYGDPNEASHIIIRSTQSSWVMVTDASGKTVFDHVLKPGDIYKVPNKPGLSLTTGNGAGIVLVLDGVALPKVANGAPHVVKNIPLDPERLAEPSGQ